MTSACCYFKLRRTVVIAMPELPILNKVGCIMP